MYWIEEKAFEGAVRERGFWGEERKRYLFSTYDDKKKQKKRRKNQIWMDGEILLPHIIHA